MGYAVSVVGTVSIPEIKMTNAMPRIVSVIALMLVTSAAQATVVFDGGTPDGVTAFFGDANYLYEQAATKVSLGSAVTTNEIQWWGVYSNTSGSGSADAFTLNIYDGSGASPGSLLYSYALGTGGRVSTGGFLHGIYEEYLYTASFSDLNLAAGDYFFGLSNNNPTGNYWGWETTSGGSQLGGASFASSGWQTDSSENLAFQLSSTQSVPEPASLSLLGLAVATMLLMRRRVD